MGAVYLVEHADLKTRHAIKVLAPHQSRHPQIAQRFRNAARAAAIARSPNIIAVRDFGQLDGCWDLVMDYWEGATLSGFLASRGPLSHELIIRIAADALGGLAAAPPENIIHRDVKPDNVYLAQVDGDLRAMILDFGVCRLGDAPGVVTRNGLVLGTPRYMAPGQFRGEAIDHRADLWALGAIVYEMATGGWLPYDADGALRGQALDDATLSARMAHLAVDPQRRHPGITRALADAILRMLDPDPAKRPSNTSDVAGQDLGTVLAVGRMPPGVAIFVICEVLRGLAYAHGLPDPGDAARNVLVSWDGAVKVSDFGIAGAFGTRPAYPSPEQVEGALLDGRSDLSGVDRGARADARGGLTIDVTPFAEVRVDDECAPAGSAALQLPLRAGQHRIVLTGDRLHEATTLTVTITISEQP